MLTIEKIYQWRGIDQQGEIVFGRQCARKQSQLKHILFMKNITLISYKQKIYIQSNQINQKDIYQFTLLLSQLLQSGLQLTGALTLISQQFNNPLLTKTINQLINNISNGSSFHAALQQHSKYFNPTYCTLIAAGEKTGQLNKTLQQLCTQLQQTITLKKKIIQALIYPICVLTLSIFISLGLIIFALPKFDNIYKSFNAQLPTLTLQLIKLSSWLRHHWLLAGISLLFIFLLTTFINQKTKVISHTCLKLINKLPIISSITQNVIITRWCGLFSISLQAGLATAQAIHIANEAITHPTYKHKLTLITEKIMSGSSLSLAIQASKLFPEMMIQIIRIAENGADLGTLLCQLENQYQQKVKSNLNSLTQLLEPFFMLLLALILGVIIIAIYLPIFQMGAVM